MLVEKIQYLWPGRLMKGAVQNIKNSNRLWSLSDAVSNRDTSRRISGVREWHTTRYNRAVAGFWGKLTNQQMNFFKNHRLFIIIIVVSLQSCSVKNMA